MTRTSPLLTAALLAALCPATARADDFASQVTASANLSTNSLYADPSAALGVPTLLFNDPYSDNATFHRSLVASSDGPAPDGSNTLVNLGPSGNGTLTVKFNSPIVHDNRHWYGDDFLVFSNQAFNGDDDGTFVAPNTNMEQYHISSSGSTYSQLPTVSVSPDGMQWYTYPAATGTMKDANGQIVTDGFGGTSYFYPEEAYQWDRMKHTWGAQQDFTKPVDPNLKYTDFAGKTVADAIDLYRGSGGGIAFSLTGTGFSQISYVRFTGMGNVDAVSRVGFAASPTPTLSSVNYAYAGNGPQTLTATGMGFTMGSRIVLNGQTLTTTFVSPTKLTAPVPASLLSATGAYPAQVNTPAPGGGTSGTKTFTVKAVLLSLHLSKGNVRGGTAITGTVTLAQAAPADGQNVGVTSSDPSVSVPASVNVAGGQTTATFPIMTAHVSAQKQVTITATAGVVKHEYVILTP